LNIPFVKMHGAGNDYVYVDGFSTNVGEPARLARAISDRRTGVGADGLIVILPSVRGDARMAMFNADGSEGEMCGNGLRCLGKFLFDRGRAGEEMAIETRAGMTAVRVSAKDENGKARELSVELSAPRFRRSEIPMRLAPNQADEEVLGERLPLLGLARASAASAASGTPGKSPAGGHATPTAASGSALLIHAVNLGNPHCVVFVDDVERYPVTEVGPKVENHPDFPERTNVSFVEVLSRTELRQRTWERGSGETLACGSGAAAVGVIARRQGLVEEGVTIHLRGGDLRVCWKGPGKTVWLEGPAVEVFTGVFEE